MPLFAGFDLGTTFFKCMITNENGSTVGEGKAVTPKIVENNITIMKPQSFWNAIKSSFQMALKCSNIDSKEIKCVSYASQANTFILLDKNNEPLTDLIVWNTVFQQELDEELITFVNETDFSNITGISGIDNAYLLAKLLWIKKNEKEIFDQIESVMTISDYLTFGLTGVKAGDSSTAALLGLFNIKSNKWWGEAFSFLNFDSSKMAVTFNPGNIVGKTTSRMAEVIGFNSHTFFVSGGLDHLVCAYGAGIGCFSNISESTGTVLASISIDKNIKGKKNQFVGPTIYKDIFSHLTFFGIRGAGSIEDEHNREFNDMTFEEMSKLSSIVPLGSGGVVYDDINGSFFNDENKSREYRIKAVFERLSYRTMLLIQDLNYDDKSFLATGGGNRCEELVKIKAEMTGKKVITLKEKELGSFGATMLAAYGLDLNNDFKSIQKKWIKKDKEFFNPKRTLNYSKYIRNWEN